jgi:hypothetical protein
MRNRRSVEEVVAEIREALLATPSRKKRLLSSTFWQDRLGFSKRTSERVETVHSALLVAGIYVIRPEQGFGTEDLEEWVELTLLDGQSTVPTQPVDSPPRPPSAWFSTMCEHKYESEREVEYFFAIPLLNALGYDAADLAVGFPVRMNEGVRRVTKEADCIVFDGPSRSRADALLVLEAKRSDRALTNDAESQARSYALWMTTPFYVLTNGHDLRVFLFRGALQADVNILTTSRDKLEQDWAELAQRISKPAARDHKNRLLEALAKATFPPDELVVGRGADDKERK